MTKLHDSIAAAIDNASEPEDSAIKRAQAKALTKAWFAALSGRDLAGLEALMADGMIYEVPMTESGRTDDGAHRYYQGKDQVMGYWEAVFAGRNTTPDTITTPRPPPRVRAEPLKTGGGMADAEATITADGSRIFIECRGNSVRPDGRAYRNRYIFRMDIADGKFTHGKEYFNPVQSAYGFGRRIAGKYEINELG